MKIIGNNISLNYLESINNIPIADYLGDTRESGNYIGLGKNASTTTSLDNWTLYNDGTNIRPVDGIGGTTNITWTRFTTNPMSGTGEFRLFKDDQNRRGEGVSIPFTIDSKDRAKKLQITFDLKKISGVYNFDDLRVYIIANPSVTPIVIEPVNTSIETAIDEIAIKHIATFQTEINQTEYRLCIHVAGNGTNAYTVAFNNFRVWEQDKNYGAIITDWQEFNMVIGSTGTPPTKGTIVDDQARWRRVGDSLELTYTLKQNSGSGNNGTGQYLFPLPNGYKIDGSKINISTDRQNGIIGVGIADGNSTTPMFVKTWSDSNFILFTESVGEIGASVFGLGQSGVQGYSFFLKVPIQGWGSSIVLSSESGDGREVVCDLWGHPNTAQNSTIIWQNIRKQTHDFYNISTGVFTVPVTGWYRISGSALFSSEGFGVEVWSNFTSIGSIATSRTSGLGNQEAIGSRVFYFNKGQQFTIRTSGTGGVLQTSNTTSRFLNVEKISASSQIMVRDEVVACKVIFNGVVIPVTMSIVIGTSKSYDTHNAYQLSGGDAGYFICPVSGIYNFSFTAVSGGSTSNNSDWQLFNGTNVIAYGRAPIRITGSAVNVYNFSIDINMNKGERIALRVSKDTSSDAFPSDNQGASLNIKRIG